MPMHIYLEYVLIKKIPVQNVQNKIILCHSKMYLCFDLIPQQCSTNYLYFTVVLFKKIYFIAKLSQKPS